MDKNGVITISEWYKGQAESPYLGFDTIRNCDVFTTPGVAKIAYRLTPQLSNLPGIPVAVQVDEYGNTYLLIHNPTGAAGTNRLYVNGSYFTNVDGVAWDMVLYKGYLVIRSGTTLSLIKTSSGAFFSNWMPTGFVSLSFSYYGKMVVSKSDGLLYIANGENIKRILAFTAGVGLPTATMDTAIVLPDGFCAVTMDELGSRLMVGTQTPGTWFTRYSSKRATILPYRIGVSAVNFDDPVVITGANCVQQMFTSNNLIYFTAGMKGNLYVSDGTSYRKVARIPYFTKDEYGMGILYYPNAITIGNNGNLLIGTTSYFNGYFNNGTQHGVYEVNLADSKYPICLKNVISTGNFTGSQTLGIGLVTQATSDILFIGWQDGNNYGFDTTDGYKYTNYTSVIESQTYFVGTKEIQKKFQQVEISLGQPLTANQGIKLYYRTNTMEAYQTLKNFTFTTGNGRISLNDRITLPSLELIQIRIEMTTPIPPGTTTFENMELLAVKLW